MPPTVEGVKDKTTARQVVRHAGHDETPRRWAGRIGWALVILMWGFAIAVTIKAMP